jgi:prepilin-type N-terminal cleavage/methylation domain-containing protein
MRLSLLNQESAKPAGFLRWIESSGIGLSGNTTKFLPLPGGLEPLGKRRKESGRSQRSARTERAGASESLGRGEGERKLTTTYRGKKAVKVCGENPFDVWRSMLDVRCSQKKRAFTLIELVIVIVIIGIAAAMIIPEMKGGFQDALLRSTSRDLINVFSIASSRAVSLNQLHRVRIEASSGRYVIEKRTRESVQGDEYKPLNDVSEAVGTLDKRIAIQVHNLDESLTAAPGSDNSQAHPNLDAISFYSDGTADAAELLLRDRQGYRMALRINPITAHVKIQELERE